MCFVSSIAIHFIFATYLNIFKRKHDVCGFCRALQYILLKAYVIINQNI